MGLPPHSRVWPSGPLSGLTHNLMHVSWATVSSYSRHAGRECRSGSTAWPRARAAVAGGGRYAGTVPRAAAAPALRRAAPLRPAHPPRPRRLHLLGHRCRRRRRLRADPIPRPQRRRPLSRQRLHPFPGTYAPTQLSRRKKCCHIFAISLALNIISDAGPGPVFAGFGA